MNGEKYRKGVSEEFLAAEEYLLRDDGRRRRANQQNQ